MPTDGTIFIFVSFAIHVLAYLEPPTDVFLDSS